MREVIGIPGNWTSTKNCKYMYYKHWWLHTKLENRFKLSVHDKKIFGSTL